MPNDQAQKWNTVVSSHAAIASEMSGIVRHAGAGRPGDSIALLIRNAARALGIPHGRIRRLWYENAQVITALEADRLRAWHRQHLARRADRLNAELAELQRQAAALEERA
jgi:hypothetical protein